MRALTFAFLGLLAVGVLAFVFDGGPEPHAFAPLAAAAPKRPPVAAIPAVPPARPAGPSPAVRAAAILRVLGFGDSVIVVDPADREMLATPEGEAALRYLAERARARR